MDRKEKELFTLTWSLIPRYHELLGNVLPVVHEIVTVLAAGRMPNDEQLRTWKERYDEMNQRLHELTAAHEALRPVIEPLFRPDA